MGEGIENAFNFLVGLEIMRGGWNFIFKSTVFNCLFQNVEIFRFGKRERWETLSYKKLFSRMKKLNYFEHFTVNSCSFLVSGNKLEKFYGEANNFRL